MPDRPNAPGVIPVRDTVDHERSADLPRLDYGENVTDAERIAELETEVDRLTVENHGLRESLAVIRHYSDPSRIPNVS